MSSAIPIFIRGWEGGGVHLISGVEVVKKRESSDLRSPEVGISVKVLHGQFVIRFTSKISTKPHIFFIFKCNVLIYTILLRPQ